MTKYYKLTCVIPCYWCPDGVNICSYWVGLKIFMSNQNHNTFNMINFKQDEINIFAPMFKIPFLLPCLHVYNVRELQTCQLTHFFDDVNNSNLTFCTVLNWWNLRVASTLQHRQRSNLIVQNCQFAMTLLSRCLQCEGSTNLWINKSFCQFQQNKFDTLYCTEPVKP